MDSTQVLLDTRHKTHGNFSDNARVGQALRVLMLAQPRWQTLSEVDRECLMYIAGKISRILSSNADAGLKEHWEDIAGYARLAMEPNQ